MLKQVVDGYDEEGDGVMNCLEYMKIWAVILVVHTGDSLCIDQTHLTQNIKGIIDGKVVAVKGRYQIYVVDPKEDKLYTGMYLEVE